MKDWRKLIAVLVLLAPASAQAARPFFTDDARIVDQGHCQIETFAKSETAYAGSEFWLLPACNPFGVEFTVGRNRIEDEYNTLVQAKFLMKRLEPNRAGYALSAGFFGHDPYWNGIGSYSMFDDRLVVHGNLGMIRNENADRTTWGVGLEALLFAPRWYGMVETFGQRDDKPTLHFGLRFWVIPDRFQIDATHGEMSSNPEKRFNSLGLRLIF